MNGRRIREAGHDVAEDAKVVWDPHRKALPRARCSLPILHEDDPPAGTYPNTNTIDIYVASPMQGGGLSQFWTDDYGTAVAATNWSPVTHNGLVAVMPTWDEDLGQLVAHLIGTPASG